MLDDEVCSFVVADERPHFRIIHGVGQVTRQDALNAPTRHLADGKRPVQHTHVRVHAHHNEIFDPLLPKKTVNLLAVVRNAVEFANVEARDLARPGFVPRLLRGVTAAVGIVNGQRRVGNFQRSWHFHMRREQDATALGRVLIKVHRFGWRVNYLDSFGAGGVDDRRHLVGQSTAALRGALAPMLVPHVTDDDRHFRDRHLLHQVGFIPFAAPFERLNACAQFEPQLAFRPGA